MSESNYKARTEGPVTLVIRTEGQEVDCARYLKSAAVFEAFGRIASAEIVFSDGGFSDNDFVIGDSGTFLPGNTLEIDLGYNGQPRTVFCGVVTGHQVRLEKGVSELVISARHKAYRMSLCRKNARFQDMTDSDIIQEIAGRYGVRCEVDSTGVRHQTLVQHRVTDWDFMNMRAEAEGLLLLTSVDGIAAARPDIAAEPVLTVDGSFSVYKLRASMDARKPFSSFTMNAWNYSTQEMDTESVECGKYDTDAGDLGTDEIASKMQNSECVIGMDSYQENTDAMKAALEATAMRTALARITGSVTIPGCETVHPGDMIVIEKAGSRINGPNIVSSVEHQVSSEGWKTTLSFGLDDVRYAYRYDDIGTPPADCAVAGINGLQAAKVERLEGDPSGEERVMIRLLDGAETTLWARVAHSGAGTFFLPEVGDEVAVGFVNSDPAMPVVLGLLRSSGNPEPEELKDDNNIKGIYSREKLRMVFDEDKKSVSIMTPGGNSLTLSDDDKGISIKDQNGNSLVLDKGGITLKDGSGNNIKMESGGITIESAAAVTIKAGGNMTVKGTLVQIN